MQLFLDCILFLFVNGLVNCSGFLELHLQSPYDQSAIVNISSSEKSEKSRVVKVKLQPSIPLNVTRIPVNFNRTYNVTIKCGASKEEGLTETTIVSSVTPRLGLLSPAAVARPLNGIRIVVGCDENWFGDRCDLFCDVEEARKLGKKL